MAVPFTTITLDKPYKVRLGMGAMYEFEKLTGKKIFSIDEDTMDFTTCLNLLWIMLKQENKDLTIEATCSLVDDNVDDITCVIEKITEAISAAFGNKGKNPNA